MTGEREVEKEATNQEVYLLGVWLERPQPRLRAAEVLNGPAVQNVSVRDGRGAELLINREDDQLRYCQADPLRS